MSTTGVQFPSNLKNRIEEAVEEGDYTSNSDLIREAVRRLLDERDRRISEKAVKELNKRISEDEITSDELREKAGMG